MVFPVFLGIGFTIVGMLVVAWNKHHDEKNRHQ